MFAAAFQELGEGIPIRYKLNDRIFDSRNQQSKTAVYKTFIRELLYADDCALIAHAQQELQDMLSRFSSAVSKFGLTISLKKTEVVFQRSSKSRNTPDPEIKIGDTTLAIKEDFVYLGKSHLSVWSDPERIPENYEVGPEHERTVKRHLAEDSASQWSDALAKAKQGDFGAIESWVRPAWETILRKSTLEGKEFLFSLEM